MNNSKKQRKTKEWETLEISLRELETRREHFFFQKIEQTLYQEKEQKH